MGRKYLPREAWERETGKRRREAGKAVTEKSPVKNVCGGGAPGTGFGWA